MAKILVALSGGVDSAVAALLLQREGHEVHTAYMRTWMNEEGGKFLGECPWETDVVHARGVAEKLGVPFRMLDLMRDYRERVVEYMVEGYKSGITPNPDVMCNREMKFGVFLRQALADGFDGIATGHYARKRVNADGSADILTGLDPNKDQSYFLTFVRQAQLLKARFPVGELLKPEVRRLAAEAGLPNAARKDSQGICFIGKINVSEFLSQYIPESPGPVVNHEGRVVGTHKGLHRYTLGQRKGIDVPSNKDNEYYVVTSKDFSTNTLHVAFERVGLPGLYRDECFVEQLAWVNKPITERRELLARVRYRDKLTPVVFTPDAFGGAHIRFLHTQRGIAPGQVLALHEGETLLGGGVYR